MAKSERSKLLKHSEGIDRISALPGPVLSHIMSLLPTKEAVATSLLSMRWKFLWTSITNLNFDDGEARYRYPKKALSMKRKKFTQFVNRVLLLLNPSCIQNFRLKCHQELCDPFYLDSWICAAIGHTVQKLDLHLELDQLMELPLSHFYFKTLAVLKLNYDIHFNIVASASICFPNLQTLHLSKITFTIASNCSVSFPSLKELLLDSVKYANEASVHKLFASCPVLDNLVIDRSYWDNIDTPELKYLDLVYYMSEYFTAENLSSLLKARVRIHVGGSLTIDANRYSNNIFKFIGGLFKVKFLSISGGILKAVSSISANIAPVFRNFTRLELGRDSCRDWSVVIKTCLKAWITWNIWS